MGSGRERTRRRRPDEPGDRREEPERPPSPEPERLLELQRSAGNHAVSTLLARDPKPARPEAGKGTGMSVSIAKIGTIEAESVQLPVDGGPGGAPGGGKGREGEAPRTREITITSVQGPHSADLQRAVLEGRPLGDVVIVLASGRKLTLRNTVLSGYHVSAGGDAPRESWTISFGAMDFGEPGQKEGPKRSEYDYQSSL